MSFESSLTFFLAILIFGITPGPGVFALVSKGINSGFKYCVPLALGMTVSDIIYLVFACLGLSSIANNYSHIFEIIRIFGALYLIFLAYKMLTTPIKIENDTQKITNKKDFFLGFTQGFLISVSNPKVILFYIAFLPTFLDITSLSSSDIILSSFLAFLALMIGLLSISFFSNQTKKYLKSKKSVKKLNYISAFIMFCAGGFLLLNRD